MSRRNAGRQGSYGSRTAILVAATARPVFHRQRPYRCAAANWYFGPIADTTVSSGDEIASAGDRCEGATLLAVADRTRLYSQSGATSLKLALPLHDRNGAYRIRRRAIDYLSADREVDDRVPRFIYHAINASRLEKNARFLTKHLFIFA